MEQPQEQEKVFTNQEKSLLLIQEWQMYWMHQQQNNTADFKNYFNRAFGIDSNMRHHLAGKIRTVLDIKDDEISFLNSAVKEREYVSAHHLKTIKNLELKIDYMMDFLKEIEPSVLPEAHRTKRQKILRGENG